jgi:hypothetical protein
MLPHHFMEGIECLRLLCFGDGFVQTVHVISSVHFVLNGDSVLFVYKVSERMSQQICGDSWSEMRGDSINPFAPEFPEDLLPKHKKSLKIYKSLIYQYILKIFTGLNDETSVFCIKTSITKYPGLITPLTQTPQGYKKIMRKKNLTSTRNRSRVVRSVVNRSAIEACLENSEQIG